MRQKFRQKTRWKRQRFWDSAADSKWMVVGFSMFDGFLAGFWIIKIVNMWNILYFHLICTTHNMDDWMLVSCVVMCLLQFLFGRDVPHLSGSTCWWGDSGLVEAWYLFRPENSRGDSMIRVLTVQSAIWRFTLRLGHSFHDTFKDWIVSWESNKQTCMFNIMKRVHTSSGYVFLRMPWLTLIALRNLSCNGRVPPKWWFRDSLYILADQKRVNL